MKKGQSGGSAGALVAVITLLIVLYILFLPADVREDLLEDGDNGDGTAGSISGFKELLSETPGVLADLNVLEFEHHIPSVNLFALTGAETLKRVNSIFVKNSLFDKKVGEINFRIDDLGRVDNVLLSFTAKKHEGRLTILLNGAEILNNEITKRNVDPVDLEKENLAKDNTLEFMVSGVGGRFWSSNEYILENILITADITDISEQESRNVFLVTATEKHNLEKVRLKFFPDCTPGLVGTLDVLINGRNVFSAVPDCGALRPVEFDPNTLKSGENNIVFKTERGRYLIDQISIETELKQISFPTYFFDISADEFEDIQDNLIDVNLTMRFVDDLELKKARIHINGRTTSMNTREDFFEKRINDFVFDGSNGIKIEPDDSTLEIIEFRVDLLEID